MCLLTRDYCLGTIRRLYANRRQHTRQSRWNRLSLVSRALVALLACLVAASGCFACTEIHPAPAPRFATGVEISTKPPLETMLFHAPAPLSPRVPACPANPACPLCHRQSSLYPSSSQPPGFSLSPDSACPCDSACPWIPPVPGLSLSLDSACPRTEPVPGFSLSLD